MGLSPNLRAHASVEHGTGRISQTAKQVEMSLFGNGQKLFENTFLEQRYLEKNRAVRSNREKTRNLFPIGRGQSFFCYV